MALRTLNFSDPLMKALKAVNSIGGKTLTEEEMQDLVKNLFALPTYRYTPDGKRVMSLLTDEEIQKRV